MVSILIFNVGSSSIKYSFFSNNKVIEKNKVEKIYTKEARRDVVQPLLKELRDKKISIVMHRVVHGADITEPKIINKSLIQKLKKISKLAPLHNIPEIEVIEICQQLTKVKQIAVFDTSFYSTIPIKARVYGLPYQFYKLGIKKYGFHGMSHKYVTKNLKGKIISCHLGNGCSITAIKNGKAIDTSMGFTPLDGLIMGTRSGSLDPAIIPFLITKGYSISKINDLLNHKSGLLGISGISNDIRDLMKSKNSRAKLALDIFVYTTTKYIGSYVAALNGVDTIVFTAGIGENSPYIREKILENFFYLRLKIDKNKNSKNERIISTKDSKIKVLVIKTNEELQMIEDAKKLINN